MCTVTLRCGAGSVLLTMNRDERYEREAEAPPRVISSGAGRPLWIAPFDTASGGTWIGVNDRGLVSCILNGHEPADDALRGVASVPSRGSIIPRILEASGPEGAARLPEALDFSAYPSFTLLVASEAGGEVVRWRRGAGVTRHRVQAGTTFLTSSSWREPDVTRWREEAFEAWRAAGEPSRDGLPTLHLLAPPGDEERAPFMTRQDSATRSITQVRVDTAQATLTWWPRESGGSIEPALPGALLTLALARATADPAGPASA